MNRGGCLLPALLLIVSLTLVPLCIDCGSALAVSGDAVSLCFPGEFTLPGTFGCFTLRAHQAYSFISTYHVVVFFFFFLLENFILSLSNVTSLNFLFLYFSYHCSVFGMVGRREPQNMNLICDTPWLGFLCLLSS